MRRAAARYGGGVIALSPWSIRARDCPEARASLRSALQAPFVVFTSPAAAQAAATLQPLRVRPGQHWHAVGSGTAAALRRAGVEGVASPERMDSEGLLALPGLQRLDGQALGLVTAPGGRGTLVPAFEARGARVLRANVYERVARPLSPRQMARVRTLRHPAVLAVSSGEALQLVVQRADPDTLHRLRALPVVAASDRLAGLAQELGFTRTHRAASARPADMLAAAAALQASPALARTRNRLGRSSGPGPQETPR